MKKFLVLISVLILIVSAFTACGKKQDDDDVTTTTVSYEDYSLTEPSYTVGADDTSERFDTAENEYQISYYDENGFATKLETYRNGKLAFYCTVIGADEMGNSVQEKYYTADGKFVAILDNGIFFDESGNRLTEDYVLEQFDKAE